MTDTVDLQILKRMYQRLRATPGLEDVTFSDRWFSIDKDRLPAIDIDLLDARPARMSRNVHAYELMVAITAQGADSLQDDESATERLDPIIACVHRTLAADRTLGGLVAEINPEGRRWRRNELDGTVVAVEMMFKLQYACPAGDLTSIAQ